MRAQGLQPLALVLFVLIGAISACGAQERPVVNAGSSTPMAEREDARPIDGVREYSPIVGFEFGLCETDRDCRPRTCGGEAAGICATPEPATVCTVNEVGQCLAQLNPELCGCVEGACRWQRRPETLQCAEIGTDVPSTRGFTGSESDFYPLRPE